MSNNKKNKFIIFLVLIIAALIAGGCYYKFVQLPKNQSAENEFEFDKSEIKTVKKISPSVYKTIVENDLFPEIYKSKKKVLIYGYLEESDDYTANFHKKLQKEISPFLKKDYKIMALSSKNINNYLNKNLKKARLNQNKKTDKQNLREIGLTYDIIIECVSNCCIINPEKKEIIRINKNPDLVIREMKKNR